MAQIPPHAQSSGRTPWSTPVPVRASTFKPLYEEHTRFSLETDLGKIAAFSIARPDDGQQLVYCDYQLPGDFPVPLRLGAGRAGFRQGKYLKGIGRTPLAGNWRDHSDLLHSSRHMYASSAIRELIATRYLEAKGLGASIVPCEGILLRQLEPAMRADMQREVAARQPYAALLPIDRELQAISIKPGNFARWSNFLWSTTFCLGRLEEVIDLGLLLEHYASGEEHKVAPDQCGAGSIVDALDDAIERGCQNFESFFSAGVYWGSFCNNNSTIDGRFLDLEVPILLGAPMFLGLVPSLIGDQGVPSTQVSFVLGSECLDYLRQVRCAIDEFGARLESLEQRCTTALGRDFIGTIRASMTARFGEQHLLRHADKQIDRLCRLYQGAAGVPAKVEPLVAAMVAQDLGQDATFDLNWREARVRLLDSEATVRTTAFFPEHAGAEAERAGAHEREVLNTILRGLDAETDIDRIFERLLAAEISIARELGTSKEAPAEAVPELRSV